MRGHDGSHADNVDILQKHADKATSIRTLWEWFSWGREETPGPFPVDGLCRELCDKVLQGLGAAYK